MFVFDAVSVQKAEVCFGGRPIPHGLSGAHQKPQRNVLRPSESCHVVSTITHTAHKSHQIEILSCRIQLLKFHLLTQNNKGVTTRALPAAKFIIYS